MFFLFIRSFDSKIIFCVGVDFLFFYDNIMLCHKKTAFF